MSITTLQEKMHIVIVKKTIFKKPVGPVLKNMGKDLEEMET